jgi:hypothetical protein
MLPHIALMSQKLLNLDEAYVGDAIAELNQRIAVEDDPAQLVKMVLCWEGVAHSASYCSYRALQKLRSTGWTIVKHSHKPEDQSKRKLLKQLLTNEYPNADSKSITKYSINFARYLQMSDAEFEKVEKIQITHVGNRLALVKPVSSIGFGKLDASLTLARMSSSSETEQGDDADGVSESYHGTDGLSEDCQDSYKSDGSSGPSDASGDDAPLVIEQDSRRKSMRSRYTPTRMEHFDDPNPKPKGKGKNSTAKKSKKPRTPNSEQNVVYSISFFDWLGPFLQCDRIILDLNLLQANTQFQNNENFFSHYLQLLERLRFGQGVQYKASTIFRDYYNQQAVALKSYPVREIKFDPWKKKDFIRSMNQSFRAKFPEAFTRNEIVVICCLLAFPGLTYTNIDQKTRLSEKSGMYRGMSFVPQELERFFHNRLRFLQVIDDFNHPKYMEPLSSVVLNSTYCYQQLVTWGYGESFISVSDRVWSLQHFPEFLGVNGVYVRVQSAIKVVFAQVMSRKTLEALSISFDEYVVPKDYARVIVFEESISQRGRVDAYISCFVSLGAGQVDDPICLAKFKCNFKSGALYEPKIFSHLNDSGKAIYQDIPDFCPKMQCIGTSSTADIDLEYGPNLIPRRVPVEANFKPAELTGQAGHCDGNFYHARGQWVSMGNAVGNTGCGLYRVSEHVPLRNDSDMENGDLIEPLFLQGTPSMNSMSFLINVNDKTTITFPPEPSATRQEDIVDDVPFGGFDAFR